MKDLLRKNRLTRHYVTRDGEYNSANIKADIFAVFFIVLSLCLGIKSK